MVTKMPKGLRIFVIYTDGSIKDYKSEAAATIDINLREHSASGVKIAIIGNKLGMLTEVCERLLCFDKKDRCTNDEEGIARMHLKPDRD